MKCESGQHSVRPGAANRVQSDEEVREKANAHSEGNQCPACSADSRNKIVYRLQRRRVYDMHVHVSAGGKPQDRGTATLHSSPPHHPHRPRV